MSKTTNVAQNILKFLIELLAGQLLNPDSFLKRVLLPRLQKLFDEEQTKEKEEATPHQRLSEYSDK